MNIENLVQIYGSNRVLDIDSLSIDESKITALMGSNGSGKSTLFRIISGIEKPASGFVKCSIDKKDISLLLPEPALLKRSVRSNFRFVLKVNGLLSEFDERVGEVLDLVGLDESFLDKKHYALSSGQTQRIAFAISLITRKPLILLDEPTNSLDSASTKLFSKAIEYMHEKYGCGFIIASHDEKWLSKFADDRIILYNGKVSEFELINVFVPKDGYIDFGERLKLGGKFSGFEKVAINPNLIDISFIHKIGYYEGILHSLSIVYGDTMLVKIKFGDYLIKTFSKFSTDFRVGGKLYFYIADSAFVGI